MADTDFRALVEGAYNQADSGESSGDTGENSTVDGSISSGETQSLATSGASPEPSTDTTDATETPSVRARDASGKFAKGKSSGTSSTRPPAQGGQDVAAPANTVPSSPALDGVASLEQAPPVAEVVRAPQSLTPAEREHFATTSPVIQKALARIDQTVRQQMQDAAPAKRFQQEMMQVLGPHEQMFRETNTPPAQVVQSLLQTVHQLRQGSPAARAEIFANLFRSYPTDIEALAKHIDAAPAPTQAQQMDPRSIAAQVRQEVLQSIQQERQQSTTQRLQQEVEAFAADPKNEFFGDVHEDMTMLLNRNPKLNLADAYKKAIRMNDEVSGILQKRAAATAGKAATASTQQARIAASSVKSTPSTGASSGPTAPKNHRDMVAAAWDSLEGSR